ncbi:MAG: 2-oxoglutarate dehydrogenase E1 subunit family protein, partial [Neobacillus sp.]
MTKQDVDKTAFFKDFIGPNLGYMVNQFERYKQDPSSVEQEMRVYFDQLNETDLPTLENIVPIAPESDSIQMEKILQIGKLAENIRTYGHLAAKIYPLENRNRESNHIDFRNYNLSEEDLKKLPAELLCKKAPPFIRNAFEAYEYLLKIYTKSIAYEFYQVHNIDEKNWLINRIEEAQTTFSTDKRVKTLNRLFEVENFEQFLHKTFVGQKRFSIEGLDVMVPMIDEMIAEALHDGAKFINIGMSHRGRLNVLAHVLGKPYEMIFAEFQHAPNKELVPSEGSIGINFGWTGDVK